MTRERSRSRDKDRKRARSDSQDRRRARSRSRERDRHNRGSQSHKHGDSRRDGDAGRSRDTERDSRGEGGRKRQRSADDSAKINGQAHLEPLSEEEKRKKARLERLAAWKKQQEELKQQETQKQQHVEQQLQHEEAQSGQQADTAPGPAPGKAFEEDAETDKPAADVWMPWDDPSTAFGAALPAVPREIQVRQLKAAAKLAEEKAREIAAAGEVDPLDAFMAAEVLPEVKQAEAAEAAKREEARKRLAQQLAEGKPMPKLEEILEESDEEPEPDAVMDVPLKKVKLIVGPGGERIKLIERKSKARLQILKEEEELNRAFGTGPKLPVPPKAARGEDGEEGPKMSKILIYGNSNQCEVAQRMIEEAMDNKEQKAKQRHKEYERKRDAKNRDRQMYHLRHTRDYEALEVPIGTARADIKTAYRRLAKLWHPDKHPENAEEAKQKFQKIQRAYDSLMLTEEDARIEALAQ